MSPCLFCGGFLKTSSKRNGKHQGSIDYLGRRILKCKKCKKKFIYETNRLILYNSVINLKSIKAKEGN